LEDPDDYAFGEMLRSAQEVKDWDSGKIFLQASSFTATKATEKNGHGNAEFFKF